MDNYGNLYSFSIFHYPFLSLSNDIPPTCLFAYNSTATFPCSSAVEQGAVNAKVAGSNPAGGAIRLRAM